MEQRTQDKVLITNCDANWLTTLHATTDEKALGYCMEL